MATFNNDVTESVAGPGYAIAGDKCQPKVVQNRAVRLSCAASSTYLQQQQQHWFSLARSITNIVAFDGRTSGEASAALLRVLGQS